MAMQQQYGSTQGGSAMTSVNPYAKMAKMAVDTGQYLVDLMSIESTFKGQLAQSDSMMDSSTQAYLAGEMAVLTAQQQSAVMTKDFNKRQEHNAVEVAAQGRSFSGGSVQAIMQGDMANLQYDTEFAKAIGQYKDRAYKRQSENYYKAAIENVSQAKDAAVAAKYGAALKLASNLIG